MSSQTSNQDLYRDRIKSGRALRLFSASLATMSLLASTVLLLLSGWFICACALAGASASALAFNYVIPSSAIRLLTFTRILSGYGEKYFGHDALLSQLSQLRSRVYDAVMGRSAVTPKSQEMERLVTDTEHQASLSLAVYNPIIALASLLFGVSIFFSIFINTQFLYLLFAVLTLVAMLLWRFYATQHVNQEHYHHQLRYRNAVSRFLNSASIWSLNATYTQADTAKAHWAKSSVSVRRVDDNSEAYLLLFSLAGTALFIFFTPESLLGNPLVICLPLLMLALPEWFGNSLRASQAFAKASIAQKHLREYPQHATRKCLEKQTRQQGPAPIDHHITRIQLRQFAWRRNAALGSPVSTVLQSNHICYLQGGSGCGKSSLLLAMCGVLPHRGSFFVGDTAMIAEKTQDQLFDSTPSMMVYSEQFPQILSDTLRQNLRLAKPDATDQEIHAALEFACLSELAAQGLDQWLGDQGRRLSGGEKKRLGLARVRLSGAKVWLLDEPFAGQDRDTENMVAKAIDSAKKDRFIVIASHRLPEGLHPDHKIMMTEA